MSKLWTNEKRYYGSVPYSDYKYLVSGPNGSCKYEQFEEESSVIQNKKLLVSNGVGNVEYVNTVLTDYFNFLNYQYLSIDVISNDHSYVWHFNGAGLGTGEDMGNMILFGYSGSLDTSEISDSQKEYLNYVIISITLDTDLKSEILYYIMKKMSRNKQIMIDCSNTTYSGILIIGNIEEEGSFNDDETIYLKISNYDKYADKSVIPNAIGSSVSIALGNLTS